MTTHELGKELLRLHVMMHYSFSNNPLEEHSAAHKLHNMLPLVYKKLKILEELECSQSTVSTLRKLRRPRLNKKARSRFIPKYLKRQIEKTEQPEPLLKPVERPWGFYQFTEITRG